MIVTLVVAADLDGVIGRGGELPWRLPADLKRFKQTTKGHAVIMGRKTWLSIPEARRPLSERLNIVLSRDPTFVAQGAEVVISLDDAIAIGARFNDEVMIIGGAAVYRDALAVADRILLTRVHTRVEGGDARIEIPTGLTGLTGWREASRLEVAADADNPFATTVIDLRRARREAG